MFNAVNTEKLFTIIQNNIDNKKYNIDTIIDMCKFDLGEAN